MNITIVAVGRLKEDYFSAADAEYRKRLRPYCKLEVVEAKDEKALLSSIPERALVIALDERGEMPTSEQFARDLGDEAQRGGGRPIVFVIGGPDGHSQTVRNRADKLVAFGKLTIAHRLVRIVLLEQIYRAFKINRGEPYHR